LSFRSVGFGRVLLELEQFRPAISLRHLDESIDRAPDLRRQPISDALDNVLADAGCAGGNDPFEGRGRREDDPHMSQTMIAVVSGAQATAFSATEIAPWPWLLARERRFNVRGESSLRA